MITRIKLLFLGLSLSASTAFALPQFVSHGYFGCQTCHASPTGGGVLTAYGRSVDAEKLSTWSRKNEEQPLHGALGDVSDEVKERYLLGGNFRQIQTHVENEQVKDGRYFTMQRDLEAGVHVGRTWVVGTIGKETSAFPKDKYKTISRRHFVRYDITDEWMVRLGKFFPRFGLMIPAHNTGIRRGMGFDQSEETHNLELTYGGEMLEFSANAVIEPLNNNQIESSVSKQRGIYATVAGFFLENNRVSLSIGDLKDGSRRAGKYSLAVTGSIHGLQIMGEASQKRLYATSAEDTKISRFSYVRIAGDLFHGVTPYLVHEIRHTDIKSDAARNYVLGPGLFWHPRPHLEFDVSTGVVLRPATYNYTSFGSMVFHYYL